LYEENKKIPWRGRREWSSEKGMPPLLFVEEIYWAGYPGCDFWAWNIRGHSFVGISRKESHLSLIGFTLRMIICTAELIFYLFKCSKIIHFNDIPKCLVSQPLKVLEKHWKIALLYNVQHFRQVGKISSINV
jgi:hypothetical protein